MYKYNEGKRVCEEKIEIENVTSFLINRENLEVEMNIEEGNQRICKFKNKDQLQNFSNTFFKAKILARDNKPLPKYYRHIEKPAWLKEITATDEKIFADFKKHGVVFKAIIPDFGSSSLKYLVLSTGEKKLIVMTKKLIIERTILLDDITSTSLKFSSFGSIMINYTRKGKSKELKIITASLREYLLIRSLFYQYKLPELTLNLSDKELKKLPMTFFLFTFNINRQSIQCDLSTIFHKSENCSFAVICLQEVPLMQRSSIFKQIEDYFNKKEMATVAISSMWELGLFVFCKAELKQYISRVTQCELTAGFLNVVGNKGALLMSFEFMENRLAFAGIHLKHGQNNVKVRNLTIWKMFKALRFDFDLIEAPLLADHFFLLGDANYRINHSFDILVKELDKNNIDYLLKLDQLNIEKNQGRVLHKFLVILILKYSYRKVK